mgnify:FL=1
MNRIMWQLYRKCNQDYGTVAIKSAEESADSLHNLMD